ncbi:MAG: hypothetical protein E4H11_09955, partial [Myxococcales bacterium]
VGLSLGASLLAPAEWNARALTLVVSTLLGLGVAELALQSLVGARYARPFRQDARVLYRLAPGAVSEHMRAAVNGGERIRHRINEAGFRGDELRADPRDVRIVVYGDSFIQAVFSMQGNTFADRLENRLSTRIGASVEVVNAGVAGYGPDQILRKMQDELPELRPDLVLVAIFAGNDFGDLLRNKLYRLDPDGGLRENHPTLAPDLEASLALAGREFILKRLARDGLGTLRAFASTEARGLASMTPSERMDLFLEQRRKEYLENVVQGDDVVRNLTSDTYDADVSLTPDADSARYKIELMEGILVLIRDLAARIPVDLALVLIPHPLDVGGHETGEVDRVRYPNYDSRRPTAIVERIAAQHGIAHLNLFEPFAERGASELFFRGFDDHWNDRGQDVAAELVADFLVSRGLLDAAMLRLRGLAGDASGTGKDLHSATRPRPDLR